MEKAQQAASKTTAPTPPKSMHYTHIMTISSNKHKRQTVTNYKQHKHIVPHDSTKPPKNPRTTNPCTHDPGTHTPCTHAHTNDNPSDQAHTHTHKMTQIQANVLNFVRNLYKICTNFVGNL